MIGRIKELWNEWRCEHFWRPAVVRSWKESGRGGLIFYEPLFKVCDYCGKSVNINMGEFYAQFGRMPF